MADYGLTLRRLREEDETNRARENISGPNAMSPDEATAARRAREATGNIFAGDIPGMMNAPRSQREFEILDVSPRLRAYLADPENAAEARDDVRPLSLWESVSRTAMDVWGQHYQRGERDVERNRLMYRLNPYSTRAYDARPFTEADRRRLKALDWQARDDRDAGLWGGLVAVFPGIFGGIEASARRAVRDARSAIDQVYGDEPRPLTVREGVNRAVVAPLSAVVAAPAAIGGAVRGGLGFTAEQGAGDAYREFLAMRDVDGNPLDPAIAGRRANEVGIMHAAIEFGATATGGKAVGLDRLAARILEAPVRDAIRRAAVRDVAGRFAGRVALAGVNEGIEEVSQETVTIFQGLAAQAEQGGEFEGATPEQIADRLWSAFSVAFVLGSAIGSAPSGINAGFELQDVRRARLQGEMFEALAEGSTASKLRGRSARRYAEAVDRLTEDGPLAEVRIDGGRFAAFFQDRDQDPMEVADQLRGVGREALQAAIDTGGEITIPAGTYASQIAGTQADAALREHVRLGPNEMTPAEVQARIEIGVDLERAVGEARRIHAQIEATQSEQRQVLDRVESMLSEADAYVGSANRSYAQIIANNIVAWGKRAGVRPMDLIDAIGLDVRGPFGDLTARPLREQIYSRLDNVAEDIPANETPRDAIRVARPRGGDAVAVSAREATEDAEFTTSWGATLQARAGRDMVVGEAEGDARPVRRDIFEATYESDGAGRYRKRRDAVVGYYRLDAPRTIQTLEGPVDAKKGDYVLIGAVGEQWPVPPKKFRERYIEISEDPYAHFGGVNAIGAPLHTLQTARTMDANGESKEKIWQATGWERAPDGMWRFEIDDTEADWKHKTLDRFSSATHLGEVIYYQGDIDAFLSFDTLFEAYPILGSLRLTLHIGPMNAAKFEKPNGFLAQDALYVRATTREQALEIVLHELQHAIQWIEGLAGGGGPQGVMYEATWAQFGEPTLISKVYEHFYARALNEIVTGTGARGGIDEIGRIDRDLYWNILNTARQTAAFATYQNILGEMEARAVQLRRGGTFATRKKGQNVPPLSREQRRSTPPSASYDVPIERAIVLPPATEPLITFKSLASAPFPDIYGDRRPPGVGSAYGFEDGDGAVPAPVRASAEDVAAGLKSLIEKIDANQVADAHPTARQFGSDADIIALRDMIARKASAEEILASPMMRAVEQYSAETPWTATAQEAADPDFFDGREYIDPRTGDVVDAEEAIERLKDIYEAKSGGIPRREFRAVVVVGHPGAGKSTFINDLARAFGAAVLDADIAKEFVPTYEGGLNSQSVHFESAALRAAAQVDFLDSGTNVVIERVGDNAVAIRKAIQQLETSGYTVSMVHVDVDGAEAARRMASRFLWGGRYVDPAIFRAVLDKPKPTFAEIVESAPLSGYVEINANGPPGQIEITKSGGASAAQLLAAINGGARSGVLGGGRTALKDRPAAATPDEKGPGYAQGEVTPRLAAFHNLSAENLLFAMKLGGIPVPSIAVTKEGVGAPSGFGEITLIARGDMVDPSDTPVYDGDVWSHRFPRAIWKKVRYGKIERLPLYKRLTALDKKYEETASSILWEYTVNAPDPERAISSMRDDASTMVAWLETKGEEAPEPTMRPAALAFEWISQPAWLEFVASLSKSEMNGYNDTDAAIRAAPAAREAIQQYVSGRGRPLAVQETLIDRMSEDLITEDGKLAFGVFNRAVFGVSNVGKMVVDRYRTVDALKAQIGERMPEYDAWVRENVRALFDDPTIMVGRKKMPMTLENVVDAMSTTQVRNKEKGLAHGPGATRAALSRKLNSLQEMRNAADWQIEKEKTIEELRKEQEALGDEWRKAVVRYYKYKNFRGEPDYFNAFDGAMRAIARTRLSGRRGLAAALRSEGFEGVSSYLIEDGLAYAKAIRETPVPYFEAKPQRGVRLNEFAGAVIPESAPQSVRDALDEIGIPYREYDRNREDAQSEAAEALANELDAYFQGSPRTGARGYFTPGYDANGELNSAIINLLEARNLSTLLHETGHLNLELLMMFAGRENAPQAIKDDAQTVLDWFGEGMTFERWASMSIDERRPYHEQFARGFEAYVMEGKSPSSALRQVFATIRTWLVAIYKSVLALKVELNDEVRAVMDRMVATDEEIAAAQKANGANQVMSREEFGGTDKQYARYLKEIDRARSEAEADLQANVMGALFADRTRQWRAEEKRQRETAELDVDADPARIALDWLAFGLWRHGPKPDWATDDLRLSLKAVLDDYGQDAYDGLPPELRKVDADDLVKQAVATRVALNRRGPQRLADWLQQYARKHGGIVDESGGLQQVIDGKRGFGRVINDQGGRHVDDAAMAAWEAGFFGPPPGRVVDGGYAQEAFHGTRADGIAELVPSERGPFGAAVYVSPNEMVAGRYGPNIYLAVVPADVFDGVGRPEDSRVNPYDVWRSQIERLVAANLELEEVIRDAAPRMHPQDGYPFFRRLAVALGSDASAQDVLRKAGFSGVSGYVDGPEIALFSATSVSRYAQGDSVRNGERPTIREFLDRLNDDIRNDASPVYSSVDAEEVANRLEYQSWANWFAERGVDLKAPAKELRAQVERALSKDNGGLHPDVLASVFGFDSGAQFLRAISTLKPREEAIKEETRKRVMEEMGGDPFADGAIAEEARIAAHRESRARAIELELDAIERATGNASRPVNAAAKDIARRQMESMTVKQVRAYDWFLSAERREARNAIEAIRKGDMTAARMHKHRQLVNFHLYRLARDAAEEMDKAQTYLRKFDRAGVRDKIDGDYLDQIDGLLEAYELRNTTQRRQRSMASLNQWAQDMEARGLGHLVDVDPRVLSEASRKPFVRLPIDEARGLVDTIRNIEHLGRLKDKLLAAQERRAFRATVDGVVAQLEATGPLSEPKRRTYTPTAMQRVSDTIRKAHAEMTRMEFLFKHLDGKANGPIWQTLWAPLAAAADKETALMRRATTDMQAIWKRYERGELGRMFNKRIETPELPVRGPNGTATSFTKAEIITIALNWGNEGNRAALLNGFGWSEENVRLVLDRELDARDWETVQAIWDLIGTFRDEAFALHEDLTGVRPKAVEATPVETKFGTFKGGYYPLKYDGERSVRQNRDDKRAESLEAWGSNWSKPMTRKGHLEARVGSGGRPVKLSMSVFTEHVNNVSHDIAYRRAVIDTMRIIEDQAFAEAFIGVAGQPMYDQLTPWLQSIAADRADPTVWFWRHLQKLRGNVAIAAMGYRLSTGLQQLTGVLQAVPELGSLRMSGAMVKLLRNPAQIEAKARFILDKSEFMRSRMTTRDRDIRETIEGMQQTDKLYPIRQHAFALVGMFDWAVSSTVWTAAYDRAMDGEVNGIDTGDEAGAISYADSMVRTTQSAGLNQDLPAIMRGTQINKLMTMFFSYFSVLYNWTANSVGDVRRGRIPPHVFVANMALIYVIAPLMAEAIAGRLIPREGEDEEERNNRVLGVILRMPFQTIPYLRDVVNAAGTTFDYQLSPVESAPKMIIRAGQDLAAGRTLNSENTAKAAVTSIGYMFGLPSGAAWPLIDYIADYVEGEETGLDPYEALVADRR